MDNNEQYKGLTVSRNIKLLSEIIQDKLDLGLPIDYSIYKKFQKKSKHLIFYILQA